MKYVSLDGLTKLMEAHPEYEEIVEHIYEHAVTVVVYRSGRKPEEASVTLSEAKAIGARPEKIVWRQYPQRMMLATARKQAIINAFPEFIEFTP